MAEHFEEFQDANQIASRPDDDMQQTENEDGNEPVRAKKRRFQEYRSAYSKTWPFILPSKKGDSYLLCKLCDTDIFIRSGGGNDITHHIKSFKHQSIEKVRKNN